MIYLFIIVFSYTLSNVLDEYMNPHMILNWYYTWLTKIGKVTNDEDGNIITAKWFIYPIGFCKICTNVYLTAIIILICSIFCTINPLFIIPLIIFTNFLVIKF